MSKEPHLLEALPGLAAMKRPSKPGPKPSLKRGMSQKTLLTKLAERPHTYSELAGATRNKRPKPFVAMIARLKVEQVIRMVYLHGTEYLVPFDWTEPPGYMQEVIDSNTKRTVDGCLVWTAYCDPKRGPMIRDKGTSAKVARRVVWEQAHGPLDKAFSLRMVICENPKCIELTHMKPARRSDEARGRPLSALHKAKISAGHIGRSKITEEDAEALRERTMTPEQVAELRGVTPQAGRLIREGKSRANRIVGHFAGLVA